MICLHNRFRLLNKKITFIAICITNNLFKQYLLMVKLEIKKVFIKKAIWVLFIQIFIFVSTIHYYQSHPFIVSTINIGYLLIQTGIIFFEKCFIGCSIHDNVLYIQYVNILKVKVKEIPLNKLKYSVNLDISLRGTTLRNVRIFNLDKLFLIIYEVDINKENLNRIISNFKRKIPENELK